VEPIAPKRVIAWDVSNLTEPDESALELLLRLQLEARRSGATIELHNAGPALADLLAGCGLADVLVIAGSGVGSGVEVHGEIEEREELGLDEEIHRGDGVV
jgi:anti-anti-sigma regulatory factor